MTTLINAWHSILGIIQGIGYLPFAIMLVAVIVLYRIHPVLGFLGALFLFAILVGLVHI